jgi:DNA-binding transcriptional regulator WhiA
MLNTIGHSMEAYLKTLKLFMKEMFDWELRCAERAQSYRTGASSYLAAKSTAMSEYDQIFKNYCSPKAKPRAYTFSEPPQNDPDREIIQSIEHHNSKKIEIITEITHALTHRHAYILVLEHDEWKILKKVVILPDGKQSETEI